MRITGWVTLSSSLLSIILHVVIGGLLIVSFEFTPEPPALSPPGNPIQAVSIDKQQVQHELRRLRDIDKQKANKELERQQRLEQKAAELQQKRITEEKKLARLEKQKQQEQLKREREELLLKKLEQEKKEEQSRLQKLAKENEEIAEKRRIEELKKQQAEQERKRAEQERNRLEKEKQQKQAELKRLEEEKRQAQDERALQEAIEAEQEILNAQQSQRDQSELARYSGLIVNAITNKFNRLGLEENLSCVLSIRMNPAGQVTEAVIVKSSTNALFDRRAISAVHAASPLPVPTQQRLFEKMRSLTITFDPE